MSELSVLLSYIGFTLGLSASATVASLIVLRGREGAHKVPVAGYPWVPGVFVVGTLAATALMASRQPLEAGLGLLTVALGFPVYWLMRRRLWRSRTSSGRTS